MIGREIKLSKKDQATLEHLADILHLFHHRNKNQHRRSIWWRHFSILRRQLNALLKDVVAFNEVPPTHLERIRKKSRDRDIQLRLNQRLHFWQNVLVSKWQSAFSQVIADGRFSVLGLVLTAALAQLCQITGITTAFEDLGQLEVEKVLEQFGKEHWENEIAGKPERGSNEDEEDLGEVVARDATLQGRKAEIFAASPSKSPVNVPTKRKIPANSPKTTQKKRRKGNAIDDLFSGLG